jgi:hypothetical protein
MSTSKTIQLTLSVSAASSFAAPNSRLAEVARFVLPPGSPSG